MRATDLLALAHVPRWCIVPVLRPQSVAEHTFGVMVLTMELLEVFDVMCSPEARTRLTTYVLTHDGEESRTGDLPGPWKRQSGLDAHATTLPWGPAGSAYSGQHYPGLTPTHRAVVKVADLLEAYIYLARWGVPASHHVQRVMGELHDDLTAVIAGAPELDPHYGRYATFVSQLINEEGR